MKKSAYFSDLAFAFCAVFLPVLCFLRYQKLSLPLALATAFLLALGVCFLLAALMQKRQRGRTLKNKEKRETEMLALHLALMSREEQTDFFAKRCRCLLGAESATPVYRNGRVFLETETQVAYCAFSASPARANDALPLLAFPTEKEAVLLCNATDREADGFLARFHLRILRAEEIYLRLKEEQLLPERYKSERAFEKKKRRKIELWLQKKNARPFLKGGALILTASLFSPFPYYYLLMGCALTATSALIRAFGKA